MLSSTALEPTSLVVDIAEANLLNGLDTLAPLLRELGNLGVLVALDGFGPNSSPARLHRLPIGALKIDRSFVAAMSDSAEAIGRSPQAGEQPVAGSASTPSPKASSRAGSSRPFKRTMSLRSGIAVLHPIPPEALEAILALEPLFS